LKGNLVHRFRRWVILALLVGILFYLGYVLWVGAAQVETALVAFNWWILLPVCGLTFLNYGTRFLKWHYLLRRLDIPMPWKADAWNFLAGLSMAISPGKAGELLKPYVVREITGVPMARSIPALVTERLTDIIAVLALLALSLGPTAADITAGQEYAQETAAQLAEQGQVTNLEGARDQVDPFNLRLPGLDWEMGLEEMTIVSGILLFLGVGALSSTRLTGLGLRAVSHLPWVGGFVPKLESLVGALHTCLSPVTLLITVLISMVAWGAECIGCMLIMQALGMETDLALATFLYTFATLFGGLAPGGLGMTDWALIQGTTLITRCTEGAATSSAFLCRLATLWIGVALGALALIKVSAMLGGSLEIETDAVEESS
jgi:uncharacterized membrane protein YbhN (UPF0104 family)